MSDPTPEQRADYLVRKLEQYIRDGRTVRGVSFRDWQTMARNEFANSFAETDMRREKVRKDLSMRRLLLVAAVTLVTIGFWGGVMAFDKNRNWMSALTLLGSGTVLLFFVGDFGVRHLWSRRIDKQRKQRFDRIENFDRQLKQLEADARLKVKLAEAEARKQAS